MRVAKNLGCFYGVLLIGTGPRSGPAFKWKLPMILGLGL